MRKYFLIFLFILTVFATTHSFSQWVQCSDGIGANHNITSVISAGGHLFAGSATGGVYRSTDNGGSWQASNTGLNNIFISSLYFSNNIIFAGTFGGGVFISVDSGSSWSAASGGLSNLYINCFYFSGNNIYTGTSDTLGNSGGVFASTNYGTNWSFAGLSGLSVRALIASGNFLLAGTGYNGTSGGIFRTSNGGANWIISNYGLPGFGLEVNHLSSIGANIYAGTGTGVYLSINNGGSWESISLQLSNVRVLSIAQFNSNLFAGTPNGVYVTTNYGVNWNLRNQGFVSGIYVRKLLTAGINLYAGTKEHSVWRRDANEIIGIRKTSEVVPDKFFLGQNYPNPFNNKSKIKYEIFETASVDITVFDVKGKKIFNLAEGNHSAGAYEIIFDGSKLASGVYFYKLSIDNIQCSIKKLVLIK